MNRTLFFLRIKLIPVNSLSLKGVDGGILTSQLYSICVEHNKKTSATIQFTIVWVKTKKDWHPKSQSVPFGWLHSARASERWRQPVVYGRRSADDGARAKRGDHWRSESPPGGPAGLQLPWSMACVTEGGQRWEALGMGKLAAFLQL